MATLLAERRKVLEDGTTQVAVYLARLKNFPLEVGTIKSALDGFPAKYKQFLDDITADGGRPTTDLMKDETLILLEEVSFVSQIADAYAKAMDAIPTEPTK